MKKKNLLLTLCFTLCGASAMAQTPVINEASQFVRGATMAFARLTVKTNGATITERGFCYSENPMPTIADSRTTFEDKLGTKSGPIYWLKNLKPATKYYMRGYVITADGQTVYADPVKFCTVPKGNVTYSLWRGEANDEIYNRIDQALKDACYYFNNMCYTTRDFDVAYSPGTPTADCNYTDRPHMNVGANTSYQRTGTIMHEMQHGLGLQNYYTQWCGNILRSGNGTGEWLGDRVTEVLHFWDNNTTSVLKGDNIHMWPYGINGAQEDDGTPMLYFINASLCQALGEDGLEHNFLRHADPYYALDQEDDVKVYIRNESTKRGRYTSYLVPNEAGRLRWVEMTAEQAQKNDSAAWLTTFTPQNQYYQFRNAATGRFITYTGSNFSTVERSAATSNENLHLMKGRVDVDGQRGYWMIHPQEGWDVKCLQGNANGAVGAASFDISNSAETQRWLIMSAEQVKAYDNAALASLQKQVSSTLKQLKALAAVPHAETQAGADDAFATALADVEGKAAAATSPSEVLTLIDEAQAAALAFLQGVSPTNAGKPFDLTFMITNPGVDTDTEGWSQAATVSYSCAEFYQTTFDFNQTIANLPAGNYRVCVQAFQRPGTSADAYDAYINGTNNVNATLYAGSNSAKIAHIAAGAQSKKLGGTEASVGSSRYIPNNMEAASLYFAKKLYDNSVFGNVAENGGSLKIGLRSQSMPSNYWVIFDNFRLYYFGNLDEQSLTGVTSATAEKAKDDGSVYTIDGRRIEGNGTQLKRGLYIVGGQKKIVK